MCNVVRGPNGEDISAFVSKVIFSLHVSFPKPVREVTQAPFEVSEVGWGEFEATIRIYFKEHTYTDTVQSIESDMLDALTKAENNERPHKDLKKTNARKSNHGNNEIQTNSVDTTDNVSSTMSNVPIELTHMIRLYHAIYTDNGSDGIAISHDIDPVLAKKVRFMFQCLCFIYLNYTVVWIFYQQFATV